MLLLHHYCFFCFCFWKSLENVCFLRLELGTSPSSPVEALSSSPGLFLPLPLFPPAGPSMSPVGVISERVDVAELRLLNWLLISPRLAHFSMPKFLFGKRGLLVELFPPPLDRERTDLPSAVDEPRWLSLYWHRDRDESESDWFSSLQKKDKKED